MWKQIVPDSVKCTFLTILKHNLSVHVFNRPLFWAIFGFCLVCDLFYIVIGTFWKVIAQRAIFHPRAWLQNRTNMGGGRALMSRSRRPTLRVIAFGSAPDARRSEVNWFRTCNEHGKYQHRCGYVQSGTKLCWKCKISKYRNSNILLSFHNTLYMWYLEA